MKRLTSILAISVIAVMSAGAARADIASTTYVNDKVSPVSTKANTNASEIEKLQTGKQDKSAMVDSTSDKLTEDNETNYPTVAAVYDIANSALGSSVNAKLDKQFTGVANQNKAVITDKDGNITTGTISSDMITNGTIANDDIAANANIAQSKISGLTASIADAKSAGTAAASALDSYKKSNDEAVKAVKATADNTAAAVNNTTTGLAATNKIATDNVEKLKTVATSATVTALTTRVGTAEANITSLQSGKQDKLVSGENGNISGSNGVTVTVGTDGKIAVTGNQSAINTAIAEAKKAGTDAASALSAYTKSNDAAVAKKADSATMTTELAKKENTSNKVTAISSTSTDIQYPSAKAVYTELAKKQNNITIDSALSSTSTNPVQNKVVNTALEGKIPVPTATNDSGLLVLTYNSTTKTYAWENIGR